MSPKVRHRNAADFVKDSGDDTSNAEKLLWPLVAVTSSSVVLPAAAAMAILSIAYSLDEGAPGTRTSFGSSEVEEEGSPGCRAEGQHQFRKNLGHAVPLENSAQISLLQVDAVIEDFERRCLALLLAHIQGGEEERPKGVTPGLVNEATDSKVGLVKIPAMMIYNLVNCIYSGTGSRISWRLVSTVFVGMLKTAFAVRVTGDKKFFFSTVYGFLYMLGYVPAQIFAALTLYDNSWDTSARLIRNFTQLQNYIAQVTWASILFFGIFHNPSRCSQRALLAKGQFPPIFSDAFVIYSLCFFALAYLIAFFWFLFGQVS
ncbi:MAG: hypothetical protein JOS17DRAFT_845549 [Linnemannia elongata]|nr:MAG: hypothetical protein JOS17DRAFT_845549 [Linnemannia elongata]